MFPVGEKRPRIGLTEIVTKMAFHVYRRATQIAATDELSHATRHMAELVVMSGRELQLGLVGECYENVGLLGVDGERLLHVDVGSPLEASLREREVAFRWRRNVDNVWPSLTQEFSEVAEILLDR